MPESEELVDLEPLSTQENLRLLGVGRVGRVGFSVDGLPHVLPVNYRADDDGTVVFRTTAGSILTAVAGQPVAFEVDGFDEHRRSGWSVCVSGQARELSSADDPRARELRQLNVVTWAPGIRQRWFAVAPEQITGRRLPLDATPSDFGWMPGIVG
jgi:nitroimidazol reductase NimA-like FMN-containing flavoprotein (pyridoxamine 5'-phosphate oxidase superfamily)